MEYLLGFIKVVLVLLLPYIGVMLIKKAYKNPAHENTGIYGFFGGALIIVGLLVLLL